MQILGCVKPQTLPQLGQGFPLASKPNPPIAPRAERLVATDKKGVHLGNQVNGEDGYGNGYEHQGFVRISPSAHLPLDIQQRHDPEGTQRENYGAPQEER